MRDSIIISTMKVSIYINFKFSIDNKEILLTSPSANDSKRSKSKPFFDIAVTTIFFTYIVVAYICYLKYHFLLSNFNFNNNKKNTPGYKGKKLTKIFDLNLIIRC